MTYKGSQQIHVSRINLNSLGIQAPSPEKGKATDVPQPLTGGQQPSFKVDYKPKSNGVTTERARADAHRPVMKQNGLQRLRCYLPNWSRAQPTSF
ncbi:hypothetical protein [Bacteroides acidifaciens]|uniref:hypothetical protein n=1 Tax=Bacteroides acidifaciens TaxID=85831 RepID=UPI003F690301